MTRRSASVPVRELLGFSVRQRYVAESGGWTLLTCRDPEGRMTTLLSGSKVKGRSSLFFCQRTMGMGSPVTSQRSRAVSPRWADTDSVGTTTRRGPEGEPHQRERERVKYNDMPCAYAFIYCLTGTVQNSFEQLTLVSQSSSAALSEFICSTCSWFWLQPRKYNNQQRI